MISHPHRRLQDKSVRSGNTQLLHLGTGQLVFSRFIRESRRYNYRAEGAFPMLTKDILGRKKSTIQRHRHIYIYNARESCLRFEKYFLHSIRAPTKFFQLCMYIGDIPKKFGARATPGTLSSSTTFDSRYAKISKSEISKSGSDLCGAGISMLDGLGGVGGWFRPTRIDFQTSNL